MTTSRLARRASVVAAGAALALVPVAAHAANIVKITYDAQGTALIKKTNSSVKLGPTKLTTELDTDTFNFTGSLPLPKSSTSFKAFGFAPVDADINFIPVGTNGKNVTGKITIGETAVTVKSTARYIIRLTNTKIGGVPTFPGNACQTKDPVSIPANTPTGGQFSLENGGNLTGTFTIGQFENCGLNTGLINALVPGSGNVANVTVSNAVFG